MSIAITLAFAAALSAPSDAAASQPPQNELSRHIYPLSAPIDPPQFVLDVSDSPDSEEWGKAAIGVAESWFTHVAQLMATDGRDPLTGEQVTERWQPPQEIRIVLKPDIGAPAYASGNTITIDSNWVASRPDDLGIVIHEMVHVIQAYPGSDHKPWWLVEGIADYIRWWRYEPELHTGTGRTRINPERDNYDNGYRITGMWLAWCSRKYDMRLVPALDLAMRRREDPVPLFEQITGKSPEQLWEEFLGEQ